MRRAAVAVILLLALVLAEAAPPEYPGDNANGPKETKGPKEPKEPDEPKEPKEDTSPPRPPTTNQSPRPNPPSPGRPNPPSPGRPNPPSPGGLNPPSPGRPNPPSPPGRPNPPSPGGPNPPSPGRPRRVRCMNRDFPSCYFREFTCPAACPDTCQVDCATCAPVCDCNRPGAVCQDPRFVGADGITFYFHGKKDQDFCLVSDSNLHINAHFIGKRASTMGRDFTWVQALGLLFDDHQLYLGAQKTAMWDDTVDRLSLSFDGQPIDLSEAEGASWKSQAGRVTITRIRATNAVVVEAEGNFKIKAVVVPITEKDSLIHKYGITPQEDSFAHLDLSIKFHSLSGDVNGVLGQTYGRNYVSRIKMGVTMPVLGGEREFHSSGIFATDCAVARFSGKGNGNQNSEGIMTEFADLNCASGFSGRGVVSKR